MLDLAQVDAFRNAARELGYESNELVPTRHSAADGNGNIVHFVSIGRRGKSKLYRSDSSWSEEAIANLKAGFFGVP